MPFLIVKGAFKFQHGEPDGDSVRFLAYNSSLFERLRGRIRFKSKGEVQLRYEGIDAIEKEAKEPFSSTATQRNIELLKGDKNRKTGYILVNRTDKNGRPICFVFTGNPPEADGKEIVLRKDLLTESINYQLLSEGMVYPMFYNDLYQELRDVAIEVVTEAR